MNPHYEGTFLFDNDFPALQPDAPSPGNVALLPLGGKEAGPFVATSVAESDTLLSQDPVITLFFKQRLLEVSGMDFLSYNLQPMS